MSNLTDAGVTILMAIVGVAILAVLVSQKSNTTGVIQAAASGFSNSLGMAMSPVTGASASINTSYPSSGLGGIGNLPTFSGFGMH